MVIPPYATFSTLAKNPDYLLERFFHVPRARFPHGKARTNRHGSNGQHQLPNAASRTAPYMTDLWLKMHSGEDFANGQGEVTHLLIKYRSATLEILEQVKNCPELESIADAFCRRKGDGVRSFRASLAQDADFADGIPEVRAWLGFATRANPLFLPPDGFKPAHDIGLNEIDLTRFRSAQRFVLERPATDDIVIPGSERKGADTGGAAVVGSSADLPPTGRANSDKVGVMNRQLATAKQSVRCLEDLLRSLEHERDKRRDRAMRARQVAAEAGQQKLVQKMYRLRGAAAFLEEGAEELGKEITAVRVRLFAERQDVERRRRLREAFVSEGFAKDRARKRRQNRGRVKQAPLGQNAPHLQDDEKYEEAGRELKEESAATIQSRVRGLRAREEVRGLRKKQQSNMAAVRIEAVTRGWLTRRHLSIAACDLTNSLTGNSTGASMIEKSNPGESIATFGDSVCRAGIEEEKGEYDSTPVVEECLQETPRQESLPALVPGAVSGAATLEDLGVEGVRAFFDSLGLGDCVDGHHRPLGSVDGDYQADGERSEKIGVDGVELARIARAEDTNAELLALGVRARLHRVKIIAALGVSKAPSTGGCSSVSCASTDPSRVPSTAVAAVAALQMTRRLRQEQKAMLETFARMRRRVESVSECKENGSTRSGVEMTQASEHARGEREVGYDSDGDEFVCSSQVSTTSGVTCGHERGKTEGNRRNPWSNISRAPERRINTVKDIASASVPVVLLSELEAAVAAQATLAGQARELLEYHSTNRREPGGSAVDNYCHVGICERGGNSFMSSAPPQGSVGEPTSTIT